MSRRAEYPVFRKYLGCHEGGELSIICRHPMRAEHFVAINLSMYCRPLVLFNVSFHHRQAKFLESYATMCNTSSFLLLDCTNYWRLKHIQLKSTLSPSLSFTCFNRLLSRVCKILLVFELNSKCSRLSLIKVCYFYYFQVDMNRQAALKATCIMLRCTRERKSQ